MKTHYSPFFVTFFVSVKQTIRFSLNAICNGCLEQFTLDMSSTMELLYRGNRSDFFPWKIFNEFLMMDKI